MCEALSLLFESTKLTLKFLTLDVLQNVEAKGGSEHLVTTCATQTCDGA